MMEVTLQLPESLYKQAQEWAAVTQQELDAALTDALTVALTPVFAMPELDIPITTLPDEDLLAQVEMTMPTTAGQRLTHLLAQQQEDNLSAEQRRELLSLFQLYQRLWLRQSEALAEAVRRGLRPLLHA